MQASQKTQGVSLPSVSAKSGPTPIAPELLQFIGGGVAAPTATPQAPKNTW